MPSITQRRRKFWIQYYVPGSQKPVRQSLGTEDRAEAQLISDKLERVLALLDPRVAAVELPETILATLPEAPNLSGLASAKAVAEDALPGAQKPHTPLKTAIGSYYRHISESNSARWVAGKIKVLRVLFGDALVADATSLSFAHLASERGKFRGKTLEDIPSTLLADLVAGCKARDGESPASTKTKRHYREVLHHFFEHCLANGMMSVTNFHTPNPVAALPSYLGEKSEISFLRQTPESPEIEQQYSAVASDPSLTAAVKIMIEAGLRRSEVLWLDRDSISADFKVLSITTRYDAECDRQSSLKTSKSHRSVTISPTLREFLKKHLITLQGRWLVPSPRGAQWDADNFSSALRAANEARGLPWTCLDFRHTFATRRAFVDKWTSIRLAREMGTSVAMIDRYYAGFLRHDEE